MSSLASVCASSLSVLAFACEIDLSRRVLATITRIPRACSTEVTFSAPLVASSATRSLATKLSANSSSAGTRVGTLPADLISLPSAIATSQKSRCTSNPNPRTSSPFVEMIRRAAGHTTGRIRALSTPGKVAGAATNNVELAAHQSDRPARPRLPTMPRVPGARCSRRGRTGVSSPDNGSGYRSIVHAVACRALGIRHIRTRAYRPQTNGKAERFIRTMLGGWTYGAIYRDSTERAAALDGWLWHYNHHRRHSALGHKPPIVRLNERTNLLGTYS